MSSFFYIDRSNVTFEDFIASPDIKTQLMAFLHEQQFKELFMQYKIPVGNKLILHGETGCGKTMTAKVIANHLNKKLVIVNLATIISSKLGETAKNIDALFKEAQYESMVLSI
jgi:SpoVK/Ycf46/Vps4 family AAA+-type ATPase